MEFFRVPWRIIDLRFHLHRCGRCNRIFYPLGFFPRCHCRCCSKNTRALALHLFLPQHLFQLSLGILEVAFTKLDATVFVHECAKLVIASFHLIVLAGITVPASVAFALDRIVHETQLLLSRFARRAFAFLTGRLVIHPFTECLFLLDARPRSP